MQANWHTMPPAAVLQHTQSSAIGLTSNEMMVAALTLSNAQFNITGDGYAPNGDVINATDASDLSGAEQCLRDVGRIALLCNDAQLHESTAGWQAVFLVLLIGVALLLTVEFEKQLRIRLFNWRL